MYRAKHREKYEKNDNSDYLRLVGFQVIFIFFLWLSALRFYTVYVLLVQNFKIVFF